MPLEVREHSKKFEMKVMPKIILEDFVRQIEPNTAISYALPSRRPLEVNCLPSNT